MAFTRTASGALRRQPARDQRPAGAGRRGRAARRPARRPSGPATRRCSSAATSTCARPRTPRSSTRLRERLRPGGDDRAGARSTTCWRAASRCSSRRPPGRPERRELPLDGRALRLSDHAPVEASFASPDTASPPKRAGMTIVESRETHRANDSGGERAWPRKKQSTGKATKKAKAGTRRPKKPRASKPAAKKAQSQSGESQAQKPAAPTAGATAAASTRASTSSARASSAASRSAATACRRSSTTRSSAAG